MFNIYDLLGRLFFIIAIIPIHEYAHAYAAYKMGDRTAGYLGRLDLNPLKHMDPVGTLLILFTGFGWAKPVPINPNNFRDRRKGIFITALAGPAANIGLAAILMVVYKVLANLAYSLDMQILITFAIIFRSVVWTSIYLAVFNLIPLPPLDGWNMASVFLSGKTYYKIMQNSQMIYIIFIALLFSGVLSTPLVMVSSFIFDALDILTSFI